MRDDLSSPDHPSTVPARPQVTRIGRLSARRELRRRDRAGAELAAVYGTTALLGEVSMLVELTWAAARQCSACPTDRRGHGGATGSGGCVVGAARVAAGQDDVALHRVVDLLWQQLHRGSPRRTVNWHSPAARHALQVQDLRSWNDRAERRAGEVAALVRATLRTAQWA